MFNKRNLFIKEYNPNSGNTGFFTSIVQNTTTAGNIATTSTTIEYTSSERSNSDMPYFFYLIIISVVIFLLMCCVFVGTYFYKHCLRKTVITNRKHNPDLPNTTEGYNNLDADTQRQRNYPIDLDYLEPVNSFKSDYDEISDHD